MLCFTSGAPLRILKSSLANEADVRASIIAMHVLSNAESSNLHENVNRKAQKPPPEIAVYCGVIFSEYIA